MPTHNAETFGTNILNEIIGKQEGRQEVKKLFADKGLFDGPKPVRLLSRALQIANLGSDAIVLDFFSGSGTTLHAVNLLNKEDGGHRRCIMVTNNEVSVDEESAFEKLTEQLDNAQDLSQVTAAMESMLTDMTVYQE